jgi:hypothetical protein
MKFDCGLTAEERCSVCRDYWTQWRPWFSWFPIRVGPNDCRWMEVVERKAGDVHGAGFIFEFTPYDFSYRAKESTK